MCVCVCTLSSKKFAYNFSHCREFPSTPTFSLTFSDIVILPQDLNATDREVFRDAAQMHARIHAMQIVCIGLHPPLLPGDARCYH